MSTIDYLVLAGYLVGVTGVGLWAARARQTSLDQFFLGNRAVPWLATMASLIATGISCKSLIGLPGLSFKGDMTYLQMYLPLPFVAIAAAWIFLPVYSRLRMTSVFEYVGLRFGNRVRSFASVLFQIETALTTGTVIAAPSLVLSEVTAIPYHVSVAILLLLTLVYTAMGGTKAVIWTDAVQLVVFVGVPVAVIWYIGAQTDGGLFRLIRIAGEHGKLHLFEFSTASGAEVTFWAALLSMSCWHLANFSINQVNIQRFLTAPSEAECRRAMLWGSAGILAIWAGLMAIGVVLFAYNVLHPGTVADGIATDRVFPAFVLSALPAGFKGLFIAAAFAAGMSTLSSMLSSMGTVSLLDVWKLHFNDGADERKWIQRARVLTVFWGILSFAAAFFVLHFGTVVTAGIKLATVIIGALFGIFLLGLFSRRANATGTVIGAVAGMSVLIVFIATSPLSWTWYCLIGTGVTVAVGFVASLFGRPPERPLTYWDLPPASPGGTAKQAGKP